MQQNTKIEHSNKKNFLEKLFCKNKSPDIIPKTIHNIDNSLIHLDAKKVVYRLKKFNFSAYIVGGAIRDLLLGRKPKDFDVVTDAKPQEIKKIFCNARIIGKRFKLVHIIFKNRIVETATFRAEVKNKTKKGLIICDNKFGTIEEDVKSRDFGINALYYDIDTENILDYVKGYKDIKKRRIRTLKKIEVSFTEDPVRMIRAIKYSVLLNCKIDKRTIEVIKKNAKSITHCSSFRLLEEINKIIKSENTKGVIIRLSEVKLLKYFIPIIEEEITDNNSKIYIERLAKFDKEKGNLENINEKIELFWAIMLLEKIIKEINLDNIDNEKIENNKEEILLKINSALKKYLYTIKVPRKIVDNITRIYFNYIRIKFLLKYDKEIEFNINKIRSSKGYNIFFYFIKITENEGIVSLFAPIKKKKIIKKNYKNKKTIKMVETKKKNYPHSPN